MTGVASRNSALQISEIRVSCTKPTKLRVLVSVKTASTKDKATLLHEVESKAEERELAMHIYPSSIDDSSLPAHHWPRPDEQLLKKEFSFQHFRKDGIIVSAELKARNELENTDSSAPELPDNHTVRPHIQLVGALEIVQQVGKIVESAPFIEPIGAILSEVVKVYKEVKDNHGKRDALLDKVASLALDIGKAILRLKDSGHAGSISRLQSDLEEYTGLLKEARELIGAFDDRGGFIRIVKRGELGAGLDSLDRSLDSFGTRFRNNRLVDIQISLGTVAEHVSKTYDTVLEVKLEQWLNAPDPKEKHARSCGLRQESTYFIHWQDNPGNCLAESDNSRSGKTILSSTVIEELFKHRGTTPPLHDSKQTLRQCPVSYRTLSNTMRPPVARRRNYDIMRVCTEIIAWSGIRLHVLITSQPATSSRRKNTTSEDIDLHGIKSATIIARIIQKSNGMCFVWHIRCKKLLNSMPRLMRCRIPYMTYMPGGSARKCSCPIPAR
ncbi:hypothetical protein B0H13DRAFT_2138833, partial [Mycena leptocephala]